MATTYTLIASNTLSSSAASVTFSAIPNTFTDLVVRTSVRTTYNSAAGDYYAWIRFNNNTSLIYTNTYMYGRAGSTASGRETETKFFDDPYTITSAGSTANTFANNELYIPNYANSFAKPVSYDIATENNSTSIGIRANAAGLFNDTTPITSITFLMPSTLEYAAGSSFFLYGIKNS